MRRRAVLVPLAVLAASVWAMEPLHGQQRDSPPPPESIPGLLAGDGPGSPTEAERAAAMAGIRARASTLSQESATRWIQLLAVVEKSEPAAGVLAARAVLRADDGDGLGGARILEDGMDGVSGEDRPSLLAMAAHLLDPDHPERAADVRRRLLELAPDAPEATEARLRLARHLAGPGQDAKRAVELLEDLIVADPGHPMAPDARRLLQSIRNR